MLKHSKKWRPNTLTAQVHFWEENEPVPWRIWKLIPAKVEEKFASSQSPSGTLGSGPLPPYTEETLGRSSTHIESEQDEFGTIVNEVIVVTTTSTVTTRKKYRVEDA